MWDAKSFNSIIPRCTGSSSQDQLWSELLQHRIFEFPAPHWFAAEKATDCCVDEFRGMNLLSLGAGWLRLTDSKLTGDFVPVAYPRWNNPSHLANGSFLSEIQILFGVKTWLHWGSHNASPDLENHVAAIQHHAATKTVEQSQHLLQGTSMHTPVKTCCFMTGTFCFSPSLALSFPLFLSILQLPTY